IKKRILFWAERITMWMVDSIIFVSKAELDRALQDGLVKKDKAVVITNGVELPKKIPSMPENNVVVLVGRLAEPKKPEDLIKAAPLVLKEVTDASFVLVGDGPKQDDLMKLAKKLA